MSSATKQVLLQPAYVLHRRPYRETSFLVDFFTPDHGRLTLIAKGVRHARSPLQGLLQPFLPLCVSWAGKSELMTLTYLEANGAAQRLQGQCLFAGFYLNELLMHLLQKWDAHPRLYQVYEKTLLTLQIGQLEQKTLRIFEKHLIEALGYGVLIKTDVGSKNAIVPNQYYRFILEQGFVLSDSSAMHTHVFSGASLQAYANEDWQDEDSLRDAKRLTRLILAPLLGAKKIQSGKLFRLPEEG